MRPVSTAILIGGHARRFDGQSKPDLLIGDRTIRALQREAIAAAGLGEPLFIGRDSASLPPAHTVADAVIGGGALGGLYTALLVATTPWVIVLAGDLPFVSPTLLHLLAESGAEHEAIVPRTAAGWHPLCAVYRRSIASRIKTRLDRGALRIRDALADLDVRPLSADELGGVDAADMLLMNVNTPDDHRRAERLARARL
jgi:molybdenum cofactor guanylyltransferase